MTPLTAGDVVRRLLGAGLVHPGDIVDGDFVVRNVSQSNGVFALSADGCDLVVKGPAVAGWGDESGLARERRFYVRVARSPGLREAAPVPWLADTLDTLLVLRATRPGETLAERFRERGPSLDDARMLGDALGAWRSISEQFADLELPGRLPWVLEALDDAPPDEVSKSPGALGLADAVRGVPELAEGLRRLRRAWRREAVVHGDVRWDNALVEHDPATARERVVLVDWEFLDIGEAGWDVAGALADLVVLEAVSAGDAPAAAEYRRLPPPALARLDSAVSASFDAFVSAYLETAPAAVAAADLDGGLRLLPARVLQIAFLHAAWGPSADLSSAIGLVGVAGALFDRGGGSA